MMKKNMFLIVFICLFSIVTCVSAAETPASKQPDKQPTESNQSTPEKPVEEAVPVQTPPVTEKPSQRTVSESKSDSSSPAATVAPSNSAGAQTVEMPVVQEAPVSAVGNVSLDFKDADIVNVLRILSLKSNVNIVAGPEVKGLVTIRLEDVPWEKALDIILRTYGYVYERKDNVIRVTTKENLTTEELVTETYVLNYTTSKEAEDAIKDILSERGRIKSVPRSNMLVVTDIPTNLYKISEVIKKMDRATPQAYINSKIVKTQLQNGENLGIAWQPIVSATGSKRPTTFPFNAYDKSSGNYDIFEQTLGSFFPNVGGDTDTTAGESDSSTKPNPNNQRGFPIQPAGTVGNNTYQFGTLDFSSFTATLNFLRQRDNTKIVSNPRITVLNNQTAKIKVGDDIPIPTLERNETTGSFEVSGFSYRETGVVLEVTPHINDTNEILVDLKPEISAQGAYVSFSSGGNATFDKFPSFTVESAQTQVLIRDGETIAIGGLMKEQGAISSTEVPILGSIPFVGKLFRSKRQPSDATNRKLETLFFVTVEIVNTQGQPVLAISKPATANPIPAKTATVAV